ncbi:hypothetical protein ACVGVM_19150 [Pseudonocardia bannensis]|uniref:Phytanoyl-CoA dioxygenase n=1 Tax=Pseudonocardia bannensis TaxID=630973 RepID=A0A848DQK6_9PSEU|nr:hypothetical protein [Pseudonocardia bannensis]NMH94803.1 hypothetical protein [Pseudonocardia bannensis]
MGPGDCRFEDLLAVVHERTDRADHPHAESVVQNVLIYDAERLRGRSGRRPGAARSRPSSCRPCPTPPGANHRVWNALLEKLAAREPGRVADYYANDVLALVSTAWPGPNYQVTSQVNVVNPGGRAQIAHHVQLPLSCGDAVFFNPALIHAAGAEGYPFPTNLDRDPPVDGLAPQSRADLVLRALDEGWEPAVVRDRLAEQSGRRRTGDG